MDNSVVQLVGGPCGQHGPYTFYKAFKYTKDGVKRIITLSEFFFVKLWMDSDLLCIGELQLLWIDKNSEQVLASLRLYFLPENTPEGRMDHGEDEVLAISEKVVLRVEDLITWITVDAEWSWGRLGKCVESIKEPKEETDYVATPFSESSLDFSDVEKERRLLDVKNNNKGPSVVILSYPRYCRYRSVMKRLEGVEDEYLRHRIANALGGFNVSSDNTRILFCRDTFDYPELEGHELLCNHLAPKLKGRPRGKRKKRSLSPGSESNESECSVTIISSTSKTKIFSEGSINGLRGDGLTPRRSTRTTDNSEDKIFIRKLTIFMKLNHTPIGRIPSLGYKELDLFSFYTKVQKLGGYDAVTTNRLWKSIFDDLSRNHSSTSAATVIRRHYERFLLAYERHEKGEEHKPLPISERRRLKNKAANRNSASDDAETSEGTSRSGNSTPVPQLVMYTPTHSARSSPQPSCSSAPDKQQQQDLFTSKPAEGKTSSSSSSLRSVRVKPERLREKNNQPADNNNVVCKPDDFEDEGTEIKPFINSLIEKSNEPITSAATPFQITVAEKAPSPVEGKESMPPVFEASDGGNQQKEPPHREVIEIPFRPASPEVIDLDSETYKNITSSNNFNETIIIEVKKQKLDILKQGGLEVTPVCSSTPSPRPSVIHQTVVNSSQAVEIIPNNDDEEKRQMPPPNRPPSSSLQQQQQQPQGKNVFSYVNGQSPPKVLQSKSIYSPSDKMVYGDPKEIFAPIPRVQTPKFMMERLGNRQTGGGILDLTVKSPQKPAVEIMQIPRTSHVPFNVRNTFKTPSLPLLDGRKVGSNLEITLVGPNDNAGSSTTKYSMKSHHYDRLTMQHHKKRTYNTENYLSSYKVPPRVEDKSRPTYSTQIYHPRESVSYQRNRNHQQIPSPSATKQYLPNLPPSMSNYLPHFATGAAKGGGGIPPYMPTVEALYYSTLQRMYSPNLPLLPQMIPVPTQEQLKFYQDLMVNNSRIRLPFFAQDGTTSTDNNSKKQ